MTTLILEADPRSAGQVACLLERDGHQAVAATAAADGRRRAQAGGLDLALVDLDLPDGEAVRFVRDLRWLRPALPIVVMTAHGAERDILAGLDAGADDYLIKPVTAPVLRARLRAHLHGGDPALQGDRARHDLRLQLARRPAREPRDAVTLTTRELGLLEQLLAHSTRIVPRRELLECVWGIRVDPGMSVLDVAVCRLRARLAAVAPAVRIRSVHGVGFQIAGA